MSSAGGRDREEDGGDDEETGPLHYHIGMFVRRVSYESVGQVKCVWLRILSGGAEEGKVVMIAGQAQRGAEKGVDQQGSASEVEMMKSGLKRGKLDVEKDGLQVLLRCSLFRSRSRCCRGSRRSSCCATGRLDV